MTRDMRSQIFLKHGVSLDYILSVSFDEMSLEDQTRSIAAWDEIFDIIELEENKEGI